MQLLTGGKEQNATSPRAIRLNRLDSDTDGIVRMKETQIGIVSYDVRCALKEISRLFILPDRFRSI